MADHIVAAHLDPNTLRPLNDSLHLKGALPPRLSNRIATSIIVEAVHLSRSRHSSTPNYVKDRGFDEPLWRARAPYPAAGQCAGSSRRHLEAFEEHLITNPEIRFGDQILFHYSAFISGQLVDEDDTLLAEAHTLMVRLLHGQP